MRRALPLLTVPLLAACVTPTIDSGVHVRVFPPESHALTAAAPDTAAPPPKTGSETAADAPPPAAGAPPSKNQPEAGPPYAAAEASPSPSAAPDADATTLTTAEPATTAAEHNALSSPAATPSAGPARAASAIPAVAVLETYPVRGHTVLATLEARGGVSSTQLDLIAALQGQAALLGADAVVAHVDYAEVRPLPLVPNPWLAYHYRRPPLRGLYPVLKADAIRFGVPASTPAPPQP